MSYQERPVSVLLVDDDPGAYLLTRELLANVTSGQFRVDWKGDFHSGLTAATNGYDVLLVEYRLGARTGLELVQEAQRQGCTAPMILLTGFGSSEIERWALSRGAADCLVKDSIDGPSLERAIRHSLDRASTTARLRASERQFRAIFDGVRDAMLIWEDDGRCVDANPAACSFLGVSREEIPARNLRELVMPAYVTDVEDGRRRLQREGWQRGEMELVRADGERRVMEYDATAKVFAGRHLSIVRDITDRRRSDQVKLRLAAIVEQTGDAIVATTLDGYITDWNAAAARDYGFLADEARDKHISIIVPPHRRGQLDDMFRRILAGETFHQYETERMRKDGRTTDVSLTISLIKDATGQAFGIASIARDLTESKRLRARQVAADRLVSLGTLAAGVAHEINNPLGYLIANVGFAIGQLDNGAAGEELTDVVAALREANYGAERVQRTARDIKILARGADDVRGPVNLRKVLDSSIRLVGNLIRHGAQLELSFGEVPDVEANENRLAQVFLNLLLNAAQSMHGQAGENTIRVTTRTEHGFVVTDIADTGCGIAPENLGRVFEPFFTTKPFGAGTGLGLSVSHGIVEHLGGEITVDSVLGQGTTFHVKLPASARLARVDAPAAQPEPGGRRGRVLVVDDEPFMLKAVLRTLRSVHDCVGVSSAEEGLQRLLAGDPFDLVLSDLMMPDMSGADLHAALMRANPAIAEKVVFLTGGAFTAEASAFLDRVPNRRMEKPFDPAQLRALVREVLG